MTKVETFQDGDWQEAEACPICLTSSHTSHCDRCNAPLRPVAGGIEICSGKCVPPMRLSYRVDFTRF